MNTIKTPVNTQQQPQKPEVAGSSIFIKHKKIGANVPMLRQGCVANVTPVK